MRRKTQYEKDRERLVPIAEKKANNEAGSRPKFYTERDHAQWAEHWNLVFHTEMDRLAREDGLLCVGEREEECD